MGFFSNLFGWNSATDDLTNSEPEIETTEINPANGLPMINGIGGVDIEGNPYGTDSNDVIEEMSDGSDFMDDASSFDDSFSGMDDSFSSFDDDF